MQAAAWIKLLQRIPADKQDLLSLRTTARIELVVQSILRFEEDCLVMLGRNAGSTDNGLLLFVPYEELSFVGFVKKMTAAEVKAVLGPGKAAVLAASVPAGEPEEEEGPVADGTGEDDAEEEEATSSEPQP